MSCTGLFPYGIIHMSERGKRMYAKERIMSIRLMDRISENREYAAGIGLTAGLKKNKKTMCKVTESSNFMKNKSG